MVPNGSIGMSLNHPSVKMPLHAGTACGAWLAVVISCRTRATYRCRWRGGRDTCMQYEPFEPFEPFDGSLAGEIAPPGLPGLTHAAGDELQARALWMSAPRRLEFRRELVPPPGPDQVRVCAIASAIS